MEEARRCPYCDEEINLNAKKCKHCGEFLDPTLAASRGGLSFGGSEKRILPTFILCWFFGVFGVHRFYVGKAGTGILQLLTLGGLGIWTLIDFIVIVMGNFTDGEGKVINKWS
jgi:hypothetical protein